MGNRKVRLIELGYSPEEKTQEIDNETKNKIKQQYPIEDEIKLLRRTIITLATQLKIELPKEFLTYNSTIEDFVFQGKMKKTQLKNNKIKIKQKEATQ